MNKLHQADAITSNKRYLWSLAMIYPAGRHPKAAMEKYGTKYSATFNVSWVKTMAICCAIITFAPRSSIPVPSQISIISLEKNNQITDYCLPSWRRLTVNGANKEEDGEISADKKTVIEYSLEDCKRLIQAESDEPNAANN